MPAGARLIRRAPNRILALTVPGEFAFKLADFRSLNELLAVEHSDYRGLNLSSDRLVLRSQVQQRNFHLSFFLHRLLALRGNRQFSRGLTCRSAWSYREESQPV